MTMVRRRAILQAALSSAALGFLSACQRRLIKPPECPHYSSPHRPRVVDAHCHIFNGSDLQVAGFINQVKLGLPDRSLLEVIGDLIQSAAWRYAPSAEEELRWLTRWGGPRTVVPMVDRPSMRSTALSAMILAMGQDTDDRFVRFWRELAARNPDQANEFATRLARYKSIRLARFSPIQGSQVLTQLQSAQGIAQFIEDEQEYGDRGIAVVTFLKTFFRFRTENAWTMMWTYGCASSPGVDLLCPALVDFDLWIGDRSIDNGHTHSHINKQLEVMRALARATQGRVYPLAPFNPLRAACDPGDGFIQYVRNSVNESGCIGFKLYPPMGFSASDNAAEGQFPVPLCPTGAQKVDRRRLDEVLGAFFQECSDLDVPVMAHTSPSNAALDGTESLAAPKYWRALMGSHAPAFLRGNSRVRVSLGHMGGDHDVDKPSPWRDAIVQLINDYPGQVFADLGYYDHVLSDSRTLEKLANQLGCLRRDETNLHVMYGSDWSMLAAVPRSYDYLNAFARFLTMELGLKQEAQENILGANALRFFALNKEGPARQRLRRFHGGRGAVLFLKRQDNPHQ